MKPRAGERAASWLLVKEGDAFARSEADFDVVKALPDSVASSPRDSE